LQGKHSDDLAEDDDSQEEEWSERQMRRILVIGAKGMLGRDLATVLRSSSDSEVIGWDLDEIDIREEKETVDKIERLGPEIVIHLAAYTNVDECESQVEQALAINAEGTRHVALGALRCQAKVVYLSTDYVFDGKKMAPYVEDDPSNPLNVYGLSKLKGEQYLQTLMEDFLIVRTQWLYGKFGRHFITSILRQAQEKGELQIVNDQVGSPTYTVDLSIVLSVLIERNARGIFHVTNSGFCTWYDFGRAILAWSGVERVRVTPISSRALNRPAPRPSYSVLSCEKLKREIGVSLRPWSEATKDYLKSLRP
jgi:dTDP-4-dehydrorhamnose reductase